MSADANRLHALRYLLIQLLLQILLRPGEFLEAASEVIICCKKFFPSPDVLDSSGEDEPDNDEAPESMDVFVDTLLSLLPQSSAPMRSSIEQVCEFVSVLLKVFFLSNQNYISSFNKEGVWKCDMKVIM